MMCIYTCIAYTPTHPKRSSLFNGLNAVVYTRKRASPFIHSSWHIISFSLTWDTNAGDMFDTVTCFFTRTEAFKIGQVEGILHALFFLFEQI